MKERIPNPPNGSWGMVNFQPTRRRTRLTPGIPPAAAGGSLKYNLQQQLLLLSENPPNGSWGIVKVPPNDWNSQLTPEIPPPVASVPAWRRFLSTSSHNLSRWGI